MIISCFHCPIVKSDGFAFVLNGLLCSDPIQSPASRKS